MKLAMLKKGGRGMPSKGQAPTSVITGHKSPASTPLHGNLMTDDGQIAVWDVGLESWRLLSDHLELAVSDGFELELRMKSSVILE